MRSQSPRRSHRSERSAACIGAHRAPELSRVQAVLADCGYAGQPFAQAIKRLLGAQVQIAKRSQLHSFAVMLQRWIVERSFAWIDTCRRLWKNCERSFNTSLQFIHLAFLGLLFRRWQTGSYFLLTI